MSDFNANYMSECMGKDKKKSREVKKKLMSVTLHSQLSQLTPSAKLLCKPANNIIPLNLILNC